LKGRESEDGNHARPREGPGQNREGKEKETGRGPLSKRRKKNEKNKSCRK